MFGLLLWASLAFTPAPNQPPPHPVVAWLYKATEPDVIVALLLPVLGGLLLWVRRTTQNEAKLGREEFKDVLIAEMSGIISKEIQILQTQIDLKIEKVSIQIDYVSRQSDENDARFKSMESSIDHLEVVTKELSAAVHASYRYDSEFLSRIDSELSVVLSHYLNCPVEIKLFRHRHKDFD
jgi:hypothetical protein